MDLSTHGDAPRLLLAFWSSPPLLAIALAAMVVLPLLALATSSPAGDLPARVDALYRERDAPGALDEMEALLRDGLATSPDDYDLLWRMARLRFWQADDAAPARKRTLGREGWQLGERAVEVHPDGTEGHYYAGICLGAYSQAVGILRALAEGLESRFNGHIDRCLREAPDFDLGGPYIAKGRYWYELPWPKRSLRKSTEMLTRALERHPENLRARLYLAETQLAGGAADEAATTLADVLQADVTYDPAEGRRVQRWARELQERIAR